LITGQRESYYYVDENAPEEGKFLIEAEPNL